MQEVVRDTGVTGRHGRLKPGARPLGRPAVARFQLASVRLAFAGSKDASTWALDALADVPAAAHEVDAGRALIDLAGSDDGAVLGQLLRPDPACAASSWTVACYRIGDLVPHTLRDFQDPVAAVRTLSDCGEPEHLAAELVASTPEGLCWVALVRAGAQVRFQLFGTHSVLERPGGHASTEGELAAVEAAQARWGALLASWHAAQSAAGPFWVARLALDPTSAAEAATAEADDLIVPATEAGTAGDRVGATADAWGVDRAEDRASMEVLFGVAVTLSELARAIDGIAEAVSRLERSVAALAPRLDVVPSAAAQQPSPSPLGSGAHAASDASEPLPGPVRRWWIPLHRGRRRHPALGDAAAEPL